MRAITAPTQCVGCGASFTFNRHGGHGARLYCSRGCHVATRRRVRDERKAERGARPVLDLTCAVCETPFTASQFARCCSAQCKRRFDSARVAARARLARQAVGVRQWVASGRPRAHLKIDGTCAECRAPFKGGLTQRYCSPQCGQRHVARFRDERIKNTEGRECFSRLEIFERDDWVCWLCTSPCDPTALVPAPLAATIDHVQPLSRGGAHARGNVRCAHFACNTKRGNNLRGEAPNLLGTPLPDRAMPTTHTAAGFSDGGAPPCDGAAAPSGVPRPAARQPLGWA